MQELTCAAGHTWLRPIKRGHKPRFCPKHKPAVPVPTHRAHGDHAVISFDLRPTIVQEILDGPDDELRRKFAYVIREFEHPRPNREPEDWRSLRYTHARLLEEARRGRRSRQVLTLED